MSKLIEKLNSLVEQRQFQINEGLKAEQESRRKEKKIRMEKALKKFLQNHPVFKEWKFQVSDDGENIEAQKHDINGYRVYFDPNLLGSPEYLVITNDVFQYMIKISNRSIIHLYKEIADILAELQEKT